MTELYPNRPSNQVFYSTSESLPSFGPRQGTNLNLTQPIITQNRSLSPGGLPSGSTVVTGSQNNLKLGGGTTTYGTIR